MENALGLSRGTAANSDSFRKEHPRPPRSPALLRRARDGAAAGRELCQDYASRQAPRGPAASNPAARPRASERAPPGGRR